MKKKVLLETSASLLVLLFLYAALSQFLAFKTFTGDLNNQPFSNGFTPWLRWLIPASMLLIATGLLFERTRLRAFQASFVLLSVFSVYIVLILGNVFNRIPCSCAGVIKSFSWSQQLLLNGLLLALSLAGMLLQKHKQVSVISPVSVAL
ncbi:MAG: hypothetical protein P0Y53_15010 [Candidatus Pseudobacter hemicellulosilyticus]|uniref:Methylamine utilisation protein MauE domain-containing protein n=1 Tax=Candidatus Pseudobacter hemicellulosilyticus TaxID=3121375 RepID=A0AAJ6BDM8_9BACT|nr:MAG: hypothetical protein P0Y53_15010 [Pseudobacter sp.]